MLAGTERLTVTNYRQVKIGVKTELQETGTFEIFGRLAETSTEDAAHLATSGVTGAATTRTLYTHEFPGNHRSVVTDSRGVEYTVIGEPQRYRRGRLTRHDRVRLQQKAPSEGITWHET